jgi:hypothetical protein
MEITPVHILHDVHWGATRGVGKWDLVDTIKVIALEAFKLRDRGSWMVSVM